MINKRALKNNIVKLYTFLYGLFHPIEKKILFDSFGGKQYSDNPRAICERMHSLYPEYELVWVNNSVDDPYGIIPDYVKIIKRSKYSLYQQLATSFCYITNENINNNIYKRKGQLFIQTWHGDIVPKKVVYDANPDGKLDREVIDYKIDDLCIAGSNIGESVYRSAFRYHGEILKCGMPRNDLLNTNNQARISQIKSIIGINPEKKVVLYAPTFRDNVKTIQKATLSVKKMIESLNTEGNNWVCLIRAHSASKGLDVQCDGINIIDVTKYPDMADLLLVSDLLLTDYSSSAGDFILKYKPAILLFFDKEEYNTKCREFNFNPVEAGFFIANSQNELNQLLNDLNETKIIENCNNIIEYFGIIATSKASDIVCNRINSEYQEYIK